MPTRTHARIAKTLPAHPSAPADTVSHHPPATSTSTDTPSVTEGTRLLSLLSQGSTDPAVHSQPPKAPTPLSATDNASSAVSRLFPPSGSSTPAAQTSDRLATEISNSSASSASFNPPAGSRLLAFASRGAVAPGQNASHKVLQSADSALNSTISVPQPGMHHSQKPDGMTPPPGFAMNMMHHGPEALGPYGHEGHISANARATPSDRSGRSYSPYNISSHADEIHDAMRFAQASEPLRRSAVNPPPDRTYLGPSSENTSPYLEQGGISPNFANAPGFDLGGNVMGNTASLAKGSRFAKFFDAKNRDGQVNVAPRRAPGGMSTSPLPGQRHDHAVLNGMGGNMADSRTMEDLFAMLQNSSQVRSNRTDYALCAHDQFTSSESPGLPSAPANRAYTFRW